MANLKLKLPPVIQAGSYIFIMWLLSHNVPLITFKVANRPIIAATIITLGTLVAISGVISFRKAKTTVDPRTPGKANELVITGIYNYTRNPMYLGILLILIGLEIFLGALSSLLIIPIFVWSMNHLQIEPEEEALQKLFGESYREYMFKVRRWL